MQHKTRTVRVPDEDWHLFLYVTRQHGSTASRVLLNFIRLYNAQNAEQSPAFKD